LEVLPSTDNDRADYMNGVSTIDLYKIYQHIHGTPKFEGLDPEEDAPFRYISADADNDEDVDDNDVYMIQQLILAYRDNLTRTSWEWVLKDELEEDTERFTEDPYDFVLSKYWPAPYGIVFPDLTRNEIQADNDKYFGYRTTKIGDCVGLGFEEVTTNDWICGDGYYITGNEILARTVLTTGDIYKVRKGSIISFEVSRNNDDDILTFELPISIPEKDFDLVNIQYASGFNPAWHYSPSSNILTVLEFSKDNAHLNIPKGKIFEFKLKAKSDIDDVRFLVGLYSNRQPEIVGMKETLLDPSLQIEIKEVIPPDLYIEIRSDGSLHEAFVESPIDQEVILKLISNQGVILSRSTQQIFHGQNHIPLDFNLTSGLYFIQISNEIQSVVASLSIP